ncbi:unnamed protein product [Nesidiocoris tenuis]|uniref:Uncharacterized protein n=1 Tax=Nesidiocoris tenuis TaxID=355587 RepID=A0A6H5FV97_9HEMI|nr:unnamed protein product [Nesidiocoris tenuis]
MTGNSVYSVYKQIQNAGPELLIPAPPRLDELKEINGQNIHFRHDVFEGVDPHKIEDKAKLFAKIEEDNERNQKVLERPEFETIRKSSSSSTKTAESQQHVYDPAAEHDDAASIQTVPPSFAEKYPVTHDGEDPDPSVRAKRNKVVEVSLPLSGRRNFIQFERGNTIPQFDFDAKTAKSKIRLCDRPIGTVCSFHYGANQNCIIKSTFGKFGDSAQPCDSGAGFPGCLIVLMAESDVEFVNGDGRNVHFYNISSITSKTQLFNLVLKLNSHGLLRDQSQLRDQNQLRVQTQLRVQAQLRDQTQLRVQTHIRDQSQLRRQSQLRVQTQLRAQTQLRDQIQLRVQTQLRDQSQLRRQSQLRDQTQL